MAGHRTTCEGLVVCSETLLDCLMIANHKCTFHAESEHEGWTMFVSHVCRGSEHWDFAKKFMNVTNDW